MPPVGYGYLILPDHEILAFGSPDKKAWFGAEDLPRHWTNRPVDQWRCSLDIVLQDVYRHRCNDTITRKGTYRRIYIIYYICTYIYIYIHIHAHTQIVQSMFSQFSLFICNNVYIYICILLINQTVT